MRSGLARALVIAIAGAWLAGCTTDGNGISNIFDAKTPSPGADAFASAQPADTDALPPLGTAGTTGSAGSAPAASAAPGLLGADPNDDLNRGKLQYRAQNFGLAEKSFRRAVETHPRDAEAWLGLAASYDRLRRFDLADRAYAQAIAILGPTPEILNNQGYSYMLRGDYRRAREKLIDAQRRDPNNKYVANNLQLLADSARKGKAIE
jgi:Flp pilus assembly protein TadD